LCLAAPLAAQDRADLGVVQRIKTEAFDRSQVMDHLFYLTDVHGPRLTGSPGFTAAADWTVKRLREMGIDNARTASWGKWGRSWKLTRFSLALVEPQYAPLSGFPLAWSAATSGPATAEPVFAPFDVDRDSRLDMKKYDEALAKYFAEWRGKLRGKIVLIGKEPEVKLLTTPLARRYTDQELADIGKAPDPQALPAIDPENPVVPQKPDDRRAFFNLAPLAVVMKVWDRQEERQDRLNKFLSDEGALAVFVPSYAGSGGTAFGEAAGSYKESVPVPLPRISLTIEHYNRIVRLLEKKVPTRVELEVKTTSQGATGEGLNILAELPGAAKPDEVVMLGAHFDSWIGGTGATDNGTGSAVMIEAMRILKKLNLRMDRTVRLGLWGGEEQGYFGSLAYVKETFGDPETMQLKPAHAKLSGYFNHDNGSGRLRGVYLQGNDAMRSTFDAWLAPFRDLGVSTVSIRDTGGTDHQPFDAVGLPGFQFIQDPLEYETRTHHSNMDVYDHVEKADLMQASAVIASVVYHAANRPELLPRKGLPAPLRRAR
jgi:hypothetical protein